MTAIELLAKQKGNLSQALGLPPLSQALFSFSLPCVSSPPTSALHPFSFLFSPSRVREQLPGNRKCHRLDFNSSPSLEQEALMD